jgi:hypothetical protein
MKARSAVAVSSMSRPRRKCLFLDWICPSRIGNSWSLSIRITDWCKFGVVMFTGDEKMTAWCFRIRASLLGSGTNDFHSFFLFSGYIIGKHTARPVVPQSNLATPTNDGLVF